MCLLLLAIALLAGPAPLRAEPAPAPDQNARPVARPSSARPPARQFTLSPEKYAQAVAYARIRYRLYFLATAYGWLVLLALLALRVAPRLRDRAEAASGNRLVQALVIAPPLLLLWEGAHLPLAVYRHLLRLHYDQSHQPWGSWLWDWTKGTLLTLVMGTLLVALLYAVIRRSPRRWWLGFWLASLPLIVLSVFVAPVLIDPLFNRFEPLAPRHPELVAQIQRVAANGGLTIPPERMFLMKASEKTKSLNAYVTGVGATRRVVVWDTTVATLTTPQTLAIFGHEMGHYVLGHIPKGMDFTAAVLLLAFFAVFHAARAIVNRWGRRWGVRGVDDWASLPVLMLVFFVLSFLADPVFNTFSRRIEHEADIYGLEVTHGVVPDAGQASADSFQIMGEISLSDPRPSPFVKFWLFSHPPLAERLVFAREYDPWSKGQKPRFVP